MLYHISDELLSLTNLVSLCSNKLSKTSQKYILSCIQALNLCLADDDTPPELALNAFHLLCRCSELFDQPDTTLHIYFDKLNKKYTAQQLDYLKDAFQTSMFETSKATRTIAAKDENSQTMLGKRGTSEKVKKKDLNTSDK